MVLKIMMVILKRPSWSWLPWLQTKIHRFWVKLAIKSESGFANYAIICYPQLSLACNLVWKHHCRMLQAGPGSGANPKEIKQRLKTGLDCLREGLAILEVTILKLPYTLEPVCSCSQKEVLRRRLWKSRRSRWLTSQHLLGPSPNNCKPPQDTEINIKDFDNLDK